jgi:putative flavoprotein involved in K+ transport
VAVAEAEQTEVLVVGGGQAGIAMSEHLGARGVPHLVLERDRVAERWRSQRWDALVTNGPVWHDRFPGREFDDVAPDGFAGKEQVADYLAAYAAQIGAPLRTGVEVTSVARHAGRRGFRAETTAGPVEAGFVVAATGPFQVPVVPALVPADAPVLQLHSSAYRNAGELPAGGVLVVGSGSSGVQIADDLRRAGRDVVLSVGRHDRPPRRYRGRDFVWWLGVLGLWDLETPPAGAQHVTIAVSGVDGGRTIDFRDLAASGITLVGRTRDWADGVVRFDDDVAAAIEGGDAKHHALLDLADAYVEANGLDLPPDPAERELGPLPACALEPVRELDLAAAGVSTIIWATGYRTDHRWLPAGALDADGRPLHRRGIGTEPGVYFLGLPWLSMRGSSFIWGVWHDAARIAAHIDTQRAYLAYPA